MAVLATIAVQRDRILEVEVAGNVGEVSLRVPTGHVAAEAFRIVVPFDRRSLRWFSDRLGGVEVRRVLKNLIGRCMTFAAGFVPDKFTRGLFG